jgi:hypothetical protein
MPSKRIPIADEFPVVQGNGSSYAIVPDAARVRWTEASAREVIEIAIGDAGQRDALLEVARALGATSLDDGEIVRVLARALVDGTLVAFEAPQVSTGRPITRSDRGVSPPTRPARARATAWVSFELVDHEGTPFAGRVIDFEHADGRLDSVTLDPRGRSPRISTTNEGGIHVHWPKRLETEIDAPHVDRFAIAADDLSVAFLPTGTTRVGLNRHSRIVVAAPPRQPTATFPSAIFGSASALPMPAVADVVARAVETCDRDRSARIGFFAHCDIDGSVAANKDLSDRRAQAVFAMVTGDWPLFERALASEPLPAARAQALLRALGCNPTAIDGEPGEQTALAIRAFRRGYNDDAWHDEGRSRAYGDLEDGSTLDDATCKALLDAYHAEYSGRLDPGRAYGPRYAGCSEFNRLGESQADHRRITLVVYGNDAPLAGDFPCTMHDSGACKIDGGAGDKPHFTCKFYRDRIGEVNVDHELTPFWDFAWLRTLTNKAHLSALTCLPDADNVEFIIARGRSSLDAEECGRGEPPTASTVVAKLRGVIRDGVAYALWAFGDEDPFDVEAWFRKAAPGALLREFEPFYFMIAGQGFWGKSAPPSYRLSEMTLGGAPDRDTSLALRTDGTLLLLRATESSGVAAESDPQSKNLRIAALTGLRLRVDAFEE